MEQKLKQRLLGTTVLVSIAIIVLPLILDGEGYRAMQLIEIDAPQRPKFKYNQNGFITPLNDLNKRNDLLNPPQPIDVKEFNGNASKAMPLEHEDEAKQGSTPDTPGSESELTTTWVMQVGSFSIEENALAVRKKLEAMDAKNTITEIESEKVNNQEVYVVKIVSDNYETLSEIAQLIKKDYPDAYIKERE